jgi:hypothetical protein
VIGYPLSLSEAEATWFEIFCRQFSGHKLFNQVKQGLEAAPKYT